MLGLSLQTDASNRQTKQLREFFNSIDPTRIFRVSRPSHLQRSAWLFFQADTHDDVLIIVSETSTEDIDPTRVAGRLVNADPHPNPVMLIEFELVECYIRYLNIVDRCSTP